MTKLVCFNNKCRKGYGYLKDATFNLTVGKAYVFSSSLDELPDHITMLDDNDEIIEVYILRNHFETIEDNRNRKLKELGI